MGRMIEPGSAATPADEEPAAPKQPPEPRPTSADETETGDASFPASDPPAVWTWEVERTADRL
jgi:hypothetical protein